MDLRIETVVWDTRKLFNIKDDKFADQILSTTIQYLQPARKNCSTNIDDLIKYGYDKDVDYLEIVASGCIINHPQQKTDALIDMITQNSTTSCFAHILHTGVWKKISDINFYTLHEQYLVLKKDIIKRIVESGIKFYAESQSFESYNWPKIKRSEDNVHDDYTPVWISLDDSSDKMYIKKINKFGVLEKLIEFCINENHKIQNISNELRELKKYTYHVQDTESFIKWFDADIKTLRENKKTIDRSHYEFLTYMKGHTNAGWLCNSQRLRVKNLNFDCLISPSPGIIPWQALAMNNYEGSVEVHFMDISKATIDFAKWFLKNYSNYFDASWSKIVNEFENLYQEKFSIHGDIEMSEEIWKEVRPILNLRWNDIRQNTKFYFNITDIISDRKYLEKVLKNNNKPFIWLSNCFRYFATINCGYTDDDVINYIQFLFRNNIKTTFIINTPDNSVQCISPDIENANKHLDHFYREVDIPELPDQDIILKEISLLEENNLFVKHRGNDHPGWLSFCLHGLSYDKTEGYEVYGYKSNDEAPYKWTDEALKYCPNLVSYFKDSGLRNRYHRLRIMKLEPNGHINFHNDDPQKYRRQWALNIAINNPPECEMHFWNNDLVYAGMVPWKDRTAYEIRIHWNHMVRNLSNQNRYHIIVHGK